MFTVRPLLVTPSPEGICSFNTTKPTPGRLMFVLGATGESPESDPTPAIARFVKVDPSALLNAPLWPALLVTLASTSSAVISPFRMFTLAALAVLCAPASAGPISPDVTLLRKSDDSAPATFSAVPSASASAPSVPETAGNTASVDWPLDPSGVLTYVLYACPPTDWATPATANAAVSPTTSPTTARRFTQCIFMPFISHSFLRFLMTLDVAASRPVLHDVAARQVREARVPLRARVARTLVRGPPAHRIATGVLWPATIVVADLELHRFTTVSRVHARPHVEVGHAHHETHTSRMTIAELVSKDGLTAEAVDPVVDRHMPGDLKGVTVDFDLAFGHDAAPLTILPEKDVEPEGKLPGHVGGRTRGHGLTSGRFIYVIVVRRRPVACGVDSPTAGPLPGDALCRRRRHPEVRGFRRHADARLVATGRDQQPGHKQSRPNDGVAVFSHHVCSALLELDDSRRVDGSHQN